MTGLTVPVHCFPEDPYSLSKWVQEQQVDAFAWRYEWMSIASLHFHWLVDNYERAVDLTQTFSAMATRHLWAYTSLKEASRACLLAPTANFIGHEALYIIATCTAAAEPSLELAQEHYPSTQVIGELSNHNSFFDCSKAERVLGWRHME